MTNLLIPHIIIAKITIFDGAVLQHYIKQKEDIGDKKVQTESTTIIDPFVRKCDPRPPPIYTKGLERINAIIDNSEINLHEMVMVRIWK